MTAFRIILLCGLVPIVVFLIVLALGQILGFAYGRSTHRNRKPIVMYDCRMGSGCVERKPRPPSPDR